MLSRSDGKRHSPEKRVGVRVALRANRSWHLFTHALAWRFLYHAEDALKSTRPSTRFSGLCRLPSER